MCVHALVVLHELLPHSSVFCIVLTLMCILCWKYMIYVQTLNLFSALESSCSELVENRLLCVGLLCLEVYVFVVLNPAVSLSISP